MTSLLHGEHLAALNTQTLIVKFKDLFAKQSSPADSFKFHRLRHRLGHRLMNGGMELAVLKELGGWVSWNSMQGYIKVMPDTIRRQFEESYQKLQEQEESEDSETLSSMILRL